MLLMFSLLIGYHVNLSMASNCQKVLRRYFSTRDVILRGVTFGIKCIVTCNYRSVVQETQPQNNKSVDII